MGRGFFLDGAGASAHPDEAGNGRYLPLVGDFMSFNEIVDQVFDVDSNECPGSRLISITSKGTKCVSATHKSGASPPPDLELIRVEVDLPRIRF